MPVKTVVCSVCGETVTHRQTLHLGDGKRACRKHSETQAAAEDMRAGEKFAKEKEKEKWKKATWRREDWYPAEPTPVEPLKPRCWICHRQGMKQDDFFSRLLIEQKKFEIVHGRSHNMFDPEEIKESAGSLMGETVLWYARWDKENTKITVPKRVYELIQMAGQMLGDKIFLVCDHCRREKGFKTLTDERQETFDWKTLSSFVAVYDICVEPAIREQAQKELEAVN
ncbi:MAG: hypothetical protein M0R80_02815 [Proteobacteria bacterium]|jgi:hypothetical protein|nr:hypothetical protein [Pseudomonadota bacterium]